MLSEGLPPKVRSLTLLGLVNWGKLEPSADIAKGTPTLGESTQHDLLFQG